MSRESKAIIKRMFFNKEIFLLGNIQVAVGEVIRIQFGLKKSGTEASEFAPFSMSEYKVLNNGLDKLSATTNDPDNELVKTLAEL